MNQKENERLQEEIELEDTHNKNLLMQRVRQEVMNDMDLQNLIAKSGVNQKVCNSCLMYLAVYKRLPPDALLGLLYHPQPEDYDKANPESLQTLAEDIEACCEAGFFDTDDQGRFVVIFELPKRVEEELDQFQFPLPLLVTPKTIVSNTDSGYYTKNHESVLLGGKKTGEDVCLEHLNLMNSIPFTINTMTNQEAECTWDGISSEMSKKNLKRYISAMMKNEDLMVEKGNKFYFSHRFDYRGRTYCQGYHLNYQGTAYNKAVLELAHKELVQN